jgi:hypothetical protein
MRRVGGSRIGCAESWCRIVAEAQLFLRWTPDGLTHEAEALISPQVAMTEG